MRRALLVLVVLLALPGQAAALMRPPLPPQEQIVYEACPGDPKADGCAYTDLGVIYVGARPNRHTLEHERAHLYDAQVLDDTERAAIMRAMGVKPPWYVATGDPCFWQPCPSEMFAEAYATCRMRLKSYRVWNWIDTSYGWYPGPVRQRRTCAAITKSAPEDVESSGALRL